MFNEIDCSNEFLKQCIDRLQQRIFELEESVCKLLDTNNLITENDKYMDIANSCQFLGIGRNTIYALMREGKLGYTILGRQRRILISDLKKYANSNYIRPQKSIL